MSACDLHERCYYLITSSLPRPSILLLCPDKSTATRDDHKVLPRKRAVSTYPKIQTIYILEHSNIDPPLAFMYVHYFGALYDLTFFRHFETGKCVVAEL